MIGRWLNGARMAFGRERNAEKPSSHPEVIEIESQGVAPPDSGPAFGRGAPPAGAEWMLTQPGAAARTPFTPTRPVRARAALFGRLLPLQRAIMAIELERAHLAIFGERGHGKTSLANVIASLAEAGGYGVVRHACSASASFSDLIGAVVDKIPPRYLRRAAADPALADSALADWTVADATAVLERLRTGHVLVFIDEFDRLRDESAKRDMTELLKNISDLGLRVSFVLVGVADSLEELLALHQSIHRSLVAIPLPLLAEADLVAMIQQGCQTLGLQIDPAALTALLLLAHDSPYYAQLLGLHATNAALRRSGRVVTPADMGAAAALVLEETRHTFEPLLADLPRSRDDLLYAAAHAPSDAFGWFTAAALPGSPDVEDALHQLTDPETGPILRARHDGDTTRFAFTRANLRNHVLLRETRRRGLI